jgi:hypothetical protein
LSRGDETVADIIEYPEGELTPSEKKNLLKLLKKEQADIADTSCDSVEQIKDEMIILVNYYQRVMSVLEDPNAEIYPDLDLKLFLLEGRIKKIRGMIKNLYEE